MGPSEEAGRLIDGDRQADYGDPRANHERIAALWNAYLGPLFNAKGEPVEIRAEDVAMLMGLVKIGRERHRHKADNITDLIGYALIYERIVTDGKDR
jgi:hypothetical protein